MGLFTSIKTFGVVELTRYIKAKLEGDAVLKNCRVKGEIGKINRSSNGHYYITLKEEEAILSCVFFRGKIYSSQQKTLKEIKSGNVVILKGAVSVYEKGGIYQFYIEDISLVKDEGYWKKLLEERRKKLEQEGIFDEKYKKQLPYFPKNIAVITSAAGAAIQDITSTLKKHNSAVRIYQIHSIVQGENAPQELIRAMDYVEKYLPFIETVIITRGGGSIEDLWAFNDEKLVRRIFQCKIPVISAVGHETDFTLCDYVADRRAATPTQAAQIVAPHRQELLDDIQKYKYQLNNITTYHLRKHRDFLTESKQKILLTYKSKLELAREELLRFKETLRQGAAYRMEIKKKKLASLQENLQNFRKNPLLIPRRKLQTIQERIAALQSSLLRNVLQKHKDELKQQTEKLSQNITKILNEQRHILRNHADFLQNLPQKQIARIGRIRQELSDIRENLTRISRNRIAKERELLKQKKSLLKASDPRQFWNQGFVIVEQNNKRIVSRKQFNPKIPFRLIWHDGSAEIDCK